LWWNKRRLVKKREKNRKGGKGWGTGVVSVGKSTNEWGKKEKRKIWVLGFKAEKKSQQKHKRRLRILNRGKVKGMGSG